MVQMGNVIGNQIYKADDAPYYRRGNRNLIIINCISIGVFLASKIYYVYRNKQKESKWNAFTDEVSFSAYQDLGILLTSRRNAKIILRIVRILAVRDWTSALLIRVSGSSPADGHLPEYDLGRFKTTCFNATRGHRLLL